MQELMTFSQERMEPQRTQQELIWAKTRWLNRPSASRSTKKRSSPTLRQNWLVYHSLVVLRTSRALIKNSFNRRVDASRRWARATRRDRASLRMTMLGGASRSISLKLTLNRTALCNRCSRTWRRCRQQQALISAWLVEYIRWQWDRERATRRFRDQCSYLAHRKNNSTKH